MNKQRPTLLCSPSSFPAPKRAVLRLHSSLLPSFWRLVVPCVRHASPQPPHVRKTSPNPSSALPNPSTHVSISVMTFLPTLCLPLPPAHKSCPSSHHHILKHPCSCCSQCHRLGFRITRVLIPGQALCPSSSSDDAALSLCQRAVG